MLAALALAFAGCAGPACDLCGRWQSNEERTLQEMERSAMLSEARKQFYRDDFFGRLVVETTPTQSRAYFPDETPDSVAWRDWEVVDRNGDDFVTRFRHDVTDPWVSKRLRLDGECYRVEQPELGFGEWFCKIGS